jgi:hypothetical protein
MVHVVATHYGSRRDPLWFTSQPTMVHVATHLYG